MTQELLNALGAGDGRPVGEGLSALHGYAPPAEAAPLPPGGASPAPTEDARRDEQCSSADPGAGAAAGGASPAPAETGKGRIATPVTRALARNDSAGEDNAASEFRIPNSELLRAHFDRLCAQGEALRAEFPDFDLTAALHDPEFLRLTAPGLGIEPRRAWLALHPEVLRRRAAADSAAALARSLASGAARPREGGGQGGTTLETDYRRLSRSEQQRLKQRIYNAAALGEKIYP